MTYLFSLLPFPATDSDSNSEMTSSFGHCYNFHFLAGSSGEQQSVGRLLRCFDGKRGKEGGRDRVGIVWLLFVESTPTYAPSAFNALLCRGIIHMAMCCAVSAYIYLCASIHVWVYL